MRFFYVRFLASFAQGAITHYFDHGKGQILVWSNISLVNYNESQYIPKGYNIKDDSLGQVFTTISDAARRC